MDGSEFNDNYRKSILIILQYIISEIITDTRNLTLYELIIFTSGIGDASDGDIENERSETE